MLASSIWRLQKSSAVRMRPCYMLAIMQWRRLYTTDYSAKAGKLEMVNLLVDFARKKGPQKLEQVLRATNQVGETALHEACRFGYSGIVEKLLGAYENFGILVDKNRISSLYWAVTTGFLDVVDMLLASCNRQPSYDGPDERSPCCMLH
ncbi:Ankyrin repeats (3 copies) [Carex littledalei]|uniref:Ankyrin repeats (3 copies) n=1 Tax=Carex littledalei TaxID=544730 RepID=A0A833RHN9_9POAL|nr:Ankyrin repeats (3 copies) [Carex littledalei]